MASWLEQFGEIQETKLQAKRGRTELATEFLKVSDTAFHLITKKFSVTL